MIRRLVSAAGSIMALTALAGFPASSSAQEGADKDQTSAANVAVVTAGEACFTDHVHVTGFLVPSQEAIVTLELDNYQVTQISAQEGDWVVAGQQLARVERIGPAASGRRQAAPVAISLVAPAGGRIEKSTAKLGEMASGKTEPLFRIAASDDIDLDADVPGLYLAEIASGMTVRLETSGGEVVGRVKRISSTIDRATQMGHVRVTLAPNNSLHVGDFARATIEAGESCGVSVPRSAVKYGIDGTTVQVVHAQIVETRPVRIGLVSDHYAEIKEGVRAGEIVLEHAGSSLRDGDRVTTIFADDSNEGGRR